LNSTVKKSSFTPGAALGNPRRRAKILFATFLFSPVLTPPFLDGQIKIVVFHLVLQN
jgi:hypothetical protein